MKKIAFCLMVLSAWMTGAEAGAVNTFMDSCAKGDMQACYQAGVDYWQGEGVRKDTKTGSSLLQLSCDEGINDACVALKRFEVEAISDVSKDENPSTPTKLVAEVISSGKTQTSTNYAPNSIGDVFNDGHWAGASGRSDWIQKDFDSVQLVTEIHIGKASTDITTNGFRLVLKLKQTNGEWIVIDELHDTNINRTELSGGAIGKSIPSYTKKIFPAIKATAFRLEFYGHGWFDATDIRIYANQ